MGREKRVGKQGGQKGVSGEGLTKFGEGSGKGFKRREKSTTRILNLVLS